MNTESRQKFHDLLRKDRRYRHDAYAFVWESLEFAQEIMNSEREKEPFPREPEHSEEDVFNREESNHVTGQELCLAAKEHAMNQYGRMAKAVLANMGIRRTRDIGNIVYNLIEIGDMNKTPEDRIEDFDDVYDFDDTFELCYKIDLSNE